MIKVKNTETIGDKKIASGKLVLLSAEFDPKEIFPSGNFWKYLIELGGKTCFPVIVSKTDEEIEVRDKVLNPENEIIEVKSISEIPSFRRLCKKILAMPENFSPELIKKIADEKLKDGEEVFVECDEKSEIKLEKNHINLIRDPKKAGTAKLGHIGHMKIKTDQPVKMDFDMEYNQLVLICGTNGSGKSLVMKYNWALSTIASVMTNAAAMSPPLDKVAQEIFDGTLEDQNINGKLSADFGNAKLELTFENGKVKSSKFHRDDDEVGIAPTPVFMSTVTRTFSQIQQYLQLEKAVGQEKMLKTYRLYDVVFVEKMKAALSKKIKLSENIKTALDNMDMGKHDIQELTLEDETFFFFNKAGKKTNVSTLSNGEQSILNMILASSL